MLWPIIGSSISRVLIHPHHFAVFGQVCMHNAHIALQQLQAFALMLHKLAFHLSGKVAALHLDKGTAKA